jgi:hypothetical protein
MDGGGCGDHAVFDRHGFASGAKASEEFRPLEARSTVPRQALETARSGVEPTLQLAPPLSFGKDQDSKPKLSEDDGIDRDVGSMSAKPVEDARIRNWFGGLAEDVSVDEVLHSVSVDSDSMGTK